MKGISEMEFSLSIFDYTFTNYQCQPCTHPKVSLALSFKNPLLVGEIPDSLHKDLIFDRCHLAIHYPLLVSPNSGIDRCPSRS
ncbi:MAG: hypothetical protein EWV84_01805 [Microcystis sp. M_QC_C_20170808_M3Col]|nr:MAG: hypothetical protein EWV84_01805 [Microcystis sp. M_QC_C_20170808_M3Col]